MIVILFISILIMVLPTVVALVKIIAMMINGAE